MLYDGARCEYRGKFAETRFKRDCLAEYAEVFKTVCVDAAYFPASVPKSPLFPFATSDWLPRKCDQGFAGSCSVWGPVPGG